MKLTPQMESVLSTMLMREREKCVKLAKTAVRMLKSHKLYIEYKKLASDNTADETLFRNLNTMREAMATKRELGWDTLATMMVMIRTYITRDGNRNEVNPIQYPIFNKMIHFDVYTKFRIVSTLFFKELANEL